MPYIVSYLSSSPEVTRYAIDPHDFCAMWMLDRDQAHRFATKEHASCYTLRFLAKWGDDHRNYKIEKV